MKNILEYLERTWREQPESIALADEERELSFRELYSLSRAGGSELIRRGLWAEPVAVFMEKRPETICAFLAAVYAGCFYVPLDASMPSRRLEMILDKLKPRLVIADELGREKLESLGLGELAVDWRELLSGAADEEALRAVRARTLDTDPVYVVFTSGSTGAPKGVTACHRSIIDYAEAICPVIGAGRDSVFAMQVPLYVDACLKELLSMIRCGSQVWLMPQNLFMFPLRALEYINRHRVNTLCWVASALTMISGLGAFQEARPHALRTVCFSSEVFPVKQLKLWREAAPGARFINFYGPTECTGISFYYEVDRDFQEGDSIPVGRPFENTGYLLLKEDGSAALPGEQGEICIKGAGLCLGYYGDEERTQAAFVQNPLNKCWPERIYRTGDMGYVNQYGELIFSSRRDDQIKNMGHRIELGEIEAGANAQEGVESSCCLWDGERKKLSLFYMGSVLERELMSRLRRELPRHMLPNKLIRLETLPLLPNGKTDRLGLEKMYKENRNGRSN